MTDVKMTESICRCCGENFANFGTRSGAATRCFDCRMHCTIRENHRYAGKSAYVHKPQAAVEIAV